MPICWRRDGRKKELLPGWSPRSSGAFTEVVEAIEPAKAAVADVLRYLASGGRSTTPVDIALGTS